MHDFSLGPPVDVGSYEGVIIDGKQLHDSNCEDGVYGCRKCKAGMAAFTDAQLLAAGLDITQDCDWCHTEVSIREICGIRPSDEPSCYYEVCRKCYHKRQAAEDIELADEEAMS